jgi:hypothetical protein
VSFRPARPNLKDALGATQQSAVVAFFRREGTTRSAQRLSTPNLANGWSTKEYTNLPGLIWANSIHGGPIRAFSESTAALNANGGAGFVEKALSGAAATASRWNGSFVQGNGKITGRDTSEADGRSTGQNRPADVPSGLFVRHRNSHWGGLGRVGLHGDDSPTAK